MRNNVKVELRNLAKDDFSAFKSSMVNAYSGWKGASFWNDRDIHKLVDVFPDGQKCILVDGKFIGCALSIIVDYDRFGDAHTYAQITGNYTFSTHNYNGSVLYGIEIFIQPEYQGMGYGRMLYDARKSICEKYNLRSLVIGGRIPTYNEHAHMLPLKNYLLKIRSKEIYDPILSFQLANEFEVRKIIKRYLPHDSQSLGFASLLEWKNVNHDPIAYEHLSRPRPSKYFILLRSWVWWWGHEGTGKTIILYLRGLRGKIRSMKSVFRRAAI